MNINELDVTYQYGLPTCISSEEEFTEAATKYDAVQVEREVVLHIMFLYRILKIRILPYYLASMFIEWCHFIVYIFYDLVLCDS
jgi:hypothetical protein